MPSAEAELRVLLEQVRDILPRIKNHKPDTRPILNVRIFADEMQAIDACAQRAGLNRSDWVRSIIGPVIGKVIRIKRDIPEGFRGQNRRQPLAGKYAPTDSDIREHAKLAAQHSIAASIARKHPSNDSATLSETAARAAPKLGRR